MRGKSFLGLAFLLIVFSLLVVYYISPFSELEFDIAPRNYNFSSNVNASIQDLSLMQFYPNMRFPTEVITYHMQEDCSLQKKQEMNDAFDIVENVTILDFVPVSVAENPDINITCNETTKYQGGMFIAGEGGPTSIVKAGDFNVIQGGTILLIRDSDCERPNIAIHELFHVLGFKHSDNPNNIMYNYTKCRQTIGDDNIQLLNELYSIESKADLVFEENTTNVFMHGRYLDMNVSVKNYGLQESKPSIIRVIVDGKDIREIVFDKIKVGNGKVISVRNIWITKRNPQNIQLKIQTESEELSKENNLVSFLVSEKE